MKMLLSWCVLLTLGQCGCLKCHRMYFFSLFDHSYVYVQCKCFIAFLFLYHLPQTNLLNAEPLYIIKRMVRASVTAFLFHVVGYKVQRNNLRSS